MASYFKLRTNMCQVRTEAKPECTWKEEYFCLGDSGLCSVNVYEGGLVYLSPVVPADKIGDRVFTVPVGAVPCSATEYATAYAKYEEVKRKKAEKTARAKELSDLLKTGKLYTPAPPVAHLLDDFTVLDLEFQGTDLLELAAVRYRDWQPVDKLQSFVQFRGALNYHVTTLTGISSADVYSAPEEKKVLQLFKHLAGDSLLVCHNISADRRVLEAARSRQGAAAPLPNQWLCTLALAKLRLPNQEHGLGKLCQDFGIATHGAHRAMRDVEMCAALLQHLHKLEPINELPAPASKAKAKKASSPTLFSEAA